MKRCKSKSGLISKPLLYLFFLFIYSANIMASDVGKINSVHQNNLIKGVVVDVVTGEPLIGVNISFASDRSRGTITDYDGEFTFDCNAGDDLIVSYIGYTDMSLTVTSQKEYTIELRESTELLEDLVVVGYASQKKVNLSGSVSSVNMEEMMESRPITNLSSGLAGLMPGVSVTSSNNRPGNDNAGILVRGKGTLNNSAPLIIIDGSEGDINNINPQDVESVSVLKDAASASIYGSRAANGVILITTKKGKAGKVRVDYTGYVSFESAGKLITPVSDYATYMELMNEAYENSGQPGRFSQESIDTWRNDGGRNPLLYPNTDWTKEVFKSSTATNHALSVSGGNEQTKFHASFGYVNNPGIMEYSGYERLTLRANIETEVRPWLTLGANIGAYSSNTEIGSETIGDVFAYAQSSTPGIVLRHPDGRYGVAQNPEDDPQANNVLHRNRLREGNLGERNFKSRFHGILNPFKGFSVTGSMSYEIIDKENWKKPVSIDRWNFLTEQIGVAGSAQTFMYNYNRKIERYFMDAVARYETRFFENRLDFNVMGGISQEQRKDRSFSAQKYDLLDPSLDVIGGAIGESTTTGGNSIWAMRSVFGRLNLGWDDKYLLELNLRGDASSRFLKDKRWGYFPSASAAWRIDQEEFMEGTRSWLDALKLRASYGGLGNNDVGNYDARSTYAQSNYVLNDLVEMGLAQTGLANTALTWETTYIANLGLDFTTLNSRLSGTLDVFNKETKDILISLPAPLVHGNSSIPKQNSAIVVNNGVEVSLNWNDKIGDFRYSIGGNFTYIQNKVKKFKGDEKAINGATMIVEGMPINTNYILLVDRMIQTQDDLDYVQKLVDDAPVVDGKKVNPFSSYKRPEMGDLLYKDTDGNGIFNDDDRVAVGHGDAPRFMFGLNLGAGWKGFDFSTLIQGVAGLNVIYKDSHFSPTVTYGNNINKTIAEGRWHEGIEGKAKYPRLLNGDGRNSRNSDWWLQDKSFLKIKNIQLGYTIPKTVVNSIGLERIRVYGSLENFFTFTSYKGIDPEVNNTDYPTMRQASIGVNVSF